MKPAQPVPITDSSINVVKSRNVIIIFLQNIVSYLFKQFYIPTSNWECGWPNVDHSVK